MDIKIDLQLHRFQNQLKIKNKASKRYIWDVIRSKWLVLQPEEMVRQLLVHYLMEDLGVNKNRIAIEKGLVFNTLQRRSDVIIYDQNLTPSLLIECKAPAVRLNQAVFEQIARYNMTLKVPYILVCNGPDAYCCKINFEKQSFEFLDRVVVE